MRICYQLISLAIILIALAVPVAALIQTDIVYNMDDTYVNSSTADTNYDGSALWSGNNSLDISEAWFRLGLSDPTGYYVLNSVLWTYVQSVTGSENYKIHKSDTAIWTETDLTWNTKPAYGNSLAQNSIGATGWNDWDITSSYSSAFNTGDSYVSYAIEVEESTNYIALEDKENSLSTGNVPYINLTMMVPEVYLLSPSDPTTTYDTDFIFQYNTTDVGNIVNCSLLFDGGVNMTNTSAPENTSSTFALAGVFPGTHNWTVRCYDVNRVAYQIEPAVRDLTVQAHVEWYSPSAATPLDVGLGVQGAAEPSGTRQVYSNNSNNNVALSCASGDCSVISSNWSTVNMGGTQSILAEFNCSTDVAGSYEADFELNSDQDASADTLTVNCTIQAPDLRVVSANITFSDDIPTDDQEINITAGIYNDGDYDASNIVVQFFKGNYSGGDQIGSDHTVDLAAGASTIVVQNWTTSVGSYDIYVVVDPDVDTNGSIYESDETNNYAYSTIDISLWTYFVGNVTGALALQTADAKMLLRWNVTDTTDSLVYVADTDSNIDFESLVPFSRNTSGSYMSDDFDELDNELGIGSYDDSISNLFTTSGVPKDTRTFTVFGNTLSDVPIVNSTNQDVFITGMLWDSSDDSNNDKQFDNTTDEDVVFVAVVNKSQAGQYGTYDYEIRVPAKLKNYKGPDVQTVTFYTEIK